MAQELSVVALAGTYAANLADDAIQECVNAWLDASGTIATNAIHIAATLAGNLAVVSINPLVRNGGEWRQYYSFKVESAQAFTTIPEVAEYTNSTMSPFLQPNIEGIPIFVSQEQGSRDVDVSQEPMIQQVGAVTTTYVADNAVPHPAEYTVSGHLIVASPLDHGLIIKPSLILQRDMLEHYTKSRRPVMYKSFDNKFHRCLITHFDWAWVDREMNAVTVNIRLMEYTPLKVSTDLSTQVIAQYGGAA